MRTVILITLFAPLLLACGSGSSDGAGGDSGATPAASSLFEGDYVFALFGGHAGDMDSAYAEWGTLASDGVFVTGLKTRNEWTTATPTPDSQITPGLAVGPFVLLTGASRRVIIEGDLCLDGAMALSGNVAVLSAQASGDDPAIAVAVRPGVSSTGADLIGTYHFFGFSHGHDPQAREVVAGKAVFDGAGGADITIDRNTNGTITGPIISTATYATSANGRLSLTIGGVSQFEGALTSDGDIAVLGGDLTTATDARGVVVLVRGSDAASNANFSGTYRRVSIGAASAALGGDWDSRQERDVADGTGLVDRLDITLNGDGILYPWLDAPGRTYAVAPDGGFDGGSPAGAVGALSPDGQFGVVALLISGVRPVLEVLVRTAP